MSKEDYSKIGDRENASRNNSAIISELVSPKQVEEFSDFQTVSQHGLEPESYRRYAEITNDESSETSDTTCCGAVAILPNNLRNIDAMGNIFPKFHVTWMFIFSTCTSIFMIATLLGIGRMFLGDAVAPGQPIFDIYVLYVCAYILGWSLTYIPRLHLPPTLGMIIVGLVARNIEINGQPLYDISTNLSPHAAVMLRNFCLVFIMMRCGLQMNATSIKRRKAMILMIAFIPSTVEMCVMALLGNSILNYSWGWAFLAGSICATTSPVVTGHCVLTLDERGYGASMSHILCASTAIDSTQIVTMYSFFYAFVLGEEEQSIAMKGLRTTSINLVLGILVGLGLGVLGIFIPHRRQAHVYRYRVLFITLASLFMSTLGIYMKVHGGGFLGIIILCFVASAGWRIISSNFNTHPIRTFVNFVWHFSQPLIMSTVSAEIYLKSWEPNRVIRHFSCISLGVISRCIAAFVITKGQNFDQKERAFISLGTIPKGTVQAALAPVAAEMSLQKLDDLNKNLTALIEKLATTMTHGEAESIAKYELNYDNRVDRLMKSIPISRDIMDMSLLSIITLAPLGAFLLMTMGPHLLKKNTSDAEVA